MSFVSKKRKNRPYDTQEYDQSHLQPDTLLFIQAHEADLVHGPQAAATATSLEVGEAGNGGGHTRVGDALIRWSSHVDLGVDGADTDEPMALSQRVEEGPPNANTSGGSGVWVDRYAPC